jgi:tetratricopeptide (TPR) repeat protein
VLRAGRPGTRRLRRGAQRGVILIALVVVYAAVASLLTPLDMGHGPVAEIRYVVPLIAVGAVLAGVTISILWRMARPVAIVALLLLLVTNYLHLGFLAQRGDRTKPWWPPTTYRYLVDVFNDFETGNDQLIGLLRKLPPGTTVRLSPGYMAYPAMFYVPELCYCDQLSEDKRIRPDLRRELPDYLFKDRVEPEVWLASSRILGYQWRESEGIEGFGAVEQEHETHRYQVQATLSLPDRYLIKPEVPTHFFAAWRQDWVQFFFMVALALDGSELSNDPALAVDPTDADALCRQGMACAYVGRESKAIAWLEEGLRVDPDHAELHFKLGQVLLHREGAQEDEQAIRQAARQFELAAQLAPDEHWRAWGSLGSARIKLGRLRNAQGRLAEAQQCMAEARRSFLAALAIKPDWPMAYFNLGYIAKLEGDDARAIERFQEALEVGPKYVPAHVNWGAILFEHGQIDEAVAHYRTALRIAPKHLQAHYALGQALLARAQQKQDAGDGDDAAVDRAEGIEHLRTALAMIPADSDMAKEIRRTFREDLGVEP